MNNLLDIALKLQLGLNILTKSYKPLKKLLLRLYTITSETSPEASYWDIIEEVYNFVTSTIITSILTSPQTTHSAN